MKKKKAKGITLVLLLVYILVAVFFFWQFNEISNRHIKMENQEIEVIREKLEVVLDGSITEEHFEKELAPFIKEHAMELVIRDMKTEKVLYSTMPTAEFWSIRELFHDDVVLYKSQGPVKVSGTEYFVSYVIYNISDGKLVQKNFKEIIFYLSVLIGIVLILLSFIVFMLIVPLENLKKAVTKMNRTQLDDLDHLIDDENVIASNLNQFAQNLNDTTKKVARDYTELEVALQFERERLMVMMDMSRAFVHDLKTPVHQTLLENELATTKYPSDERLGVLAKYNADRTDELLRQINEILTLMDTKVQDIETKVESFDFIEVFNSSWKLFQFFIAQNNLDFFPDIPQHLEVKMNMVSSKLILHNMLSNVVKYAKPHSEIEFIIVDPVDGYFDIKCINEASRENLTRMEKSEDLFAIVDNDREYSSSNGLYLVKELTNFLHGTFSLEVTENNAIMTITLPVEQVGGVYED